MGKLTESVDKEDGTTNVETNLEHKHRCAVVLTGSQDHSEYHKREAYGITKSLSVR